MRAVKFTSRRVFTAWEYDREEKYLNEMSQKGWQLAEGGCFHSEFVKAAEKSYRYCLDYNPEAMNDAAEKERYVENFAADGWEFINSTYNGWIYLRKEIREGMSEEDFEIYSDKESLMGLFERFAVLFRNISFIMFFVFCLEIYLFVHSGMWIILVFTGVVLALFVWLLYGRNRLKKVQEQLADRRS